MAAGFPGKPVLLVCFLEVSAALRTLPSLTRAGATLLFPGERSVEEPSSPRDHFQLTCLVVLLVTIF